MNKETKVMSISIITNLFLSIIKTVSGFLFHSSALTADGIHSFSDLTTDFVAIIGSYMSRKPADEKHPYGHGRIEYITSAIIGCAIIVVGFSVIGSSFHGNIIIPSVMVTFISLITILCKYFLSLYVIKKGKEYHNSILIASGFESKTDVISSVVVFLSSVFMQFQSFFFLFGYADIIATAIVGIFIVSVGFHITKENLSIILGEKETKEEYLNDLRHIILSIKEIYHIDELTLLKYGSYYKLILTISMNKNLSLQKAHDITKIVERKIKINMPNISYITIHMEPALPKKRKNSSKILTVKKKTGKIKT